MMKKTYLLITVLLVFNTLFAQVGINTTTPHPSAILDIESSDKGVLFPRMTTLQISSIPNPAKGLLVFNTDINDFAYNIGTSLLPVWNLLNTNTIVSTDADNEITTGTDGGAYLGRSVHMGKFIISAAGAITITGLPFEPSQIKFTAHANVDAFNLNADNGVGNNNGSIANAFGSMDGYATNYGSILSEQVIYVGGSGNSINDISRYASSTHCIGLRYSNQNGDNLGVTSATVTSFNPDGFTINVDSYADSVTVLFEAYR